MEGFTITISSADIMYFSAFMVVSLSILLLVVCLLYVVCVVCVKARERKKEKLKKERMSEEMLLRLVHNNDIGIKALHRHVHKFQTTYDDSFIEAVDEEMKRRGLM